jgi:hypothetical protein
MNIAIGIASALAGATGGGYRSIQFADENQAETSPEACCRVRILRWDGNNGGRRMKTMNTQEEVNWVEIDVGEDAEELDHLNVQ